jgi:hypothetical protein
MVTVAATAPRTRYVPDWDNRRIHHQMDRNIAFYAEQPDLIDERLAELDNEWNMERTVGTQLAGASLVGVILGAAVSRRFLVIPAVALGFFLQYTINGWSPPVALWRRVGIRSSREIEMERNALLALRADHRRMHAGEEPRRVAEGNTRKGKRQARHSNDGRGGRRAHESS